MTADMLQATLMEDPGYDGHPGGVRAAESAVLRMIDALALLEDNPDRAEYIDLVAQLTADEEPGDARLAKAIRTVAHWLEAALTADWDEVG